MSKILVGIDPGTNTGYAESENGRLITVSCLRIDEALWRVADLFAAGRLITVYWEDAHQRTWFANKGKEALQGAGSIKRDCTIWRDFLTAQRIPNQALPPQAGATKWDAKYFARVTGWKGRTNEHG